ncbi:hypothetical protein M0R89_15710 [Halorussus limi]|uniref:Uncharacterized protein n=1 Tax=Halorussus limi TaxID=2938695 RepID=A0A8U0HS86_9EURY|nr:hypothetical protein [Halorussus limi]UPV73972.1 hypothetical protein M0R89_15710 [Halorussus limi]
MKSALRSRRTAVRAGLATLVVCLLGLAFVAVAGGQAWRRVESVLLAVASVLVVLLLLKAAVVFVSVGLRLVLSSGE